MSHSPTLSVLLQAHRAGGGGPGELYVRQSNQSGPLFSNCNFVED